MADSKATSTYYNNLGGINQKASQYEMSTAQFLDIRNLDFDVPKALQKRPGQTYAVTAGTSGPISSLFEYIKLDGSSYVIAGSDTAMFYIASNTYSLLGSGWNNGQPADMLTFVNTLFMANGQNFYFWNGSSYLQVGLPIQSNSINGSLGNGWSLAGAFSVLGVTQSAATLGATTGTRPILWAAYAYQRTDGYLSPLNLYSTANPVTPTQQPGASCWNGGVTAGNFGNALTLTITGFTATSTAGLSGYALFLGMDIFNGISSVFTRTGFKFGDFNYGGVLYPNLDVTSNFYYFTSIPLGQTTAAIAGVTLPWADLISTLTPFSLLTTNFFTTYVPKYIEIKDNIMFAAGYSAFPSTMFYSNIGQPEYYGPESNFEVRTNDGDKILGVKSFNSILMIFKERSFHKLIGSDSNSFQLVELSNDYGCLSNKTIITVDQTIYWLDRKGIMMFNGANWQVASGPIEGIFRRMNISAAKEKACAVHHLYRNQIWFGIPVDGSTVNNLTVVFDYLIGAWTFFDGFNPASFSYIKGSQTKPTAWRGDYSGFVHFFGESFFSDSGQGITCLLQTRYENEGGENQTTIWRRFFIDVATASGITGVINGQVFSNYDSSTVQATFSMFQSQFQSRAEMGVVGKAVSAKISHSSASLPLLINGYAWSKRGLRNV